METTTAITTTVVDGWTLATDGDEPRVRDLDLADRLGYDRPRKIRELIERMIESNEISGACRRPTVGRRGFVEETIDEFWLDEEQALLVSARSNTALAADVRRALVRVFIAARRGQLVPVASVPAIDVHALAKEVASLVLVEVRALPAPAVLALPAEQLDAAVALAADGSAHAMLERFFTTPNPAKTLGVEGAMWIRLAIGEAADAESIGLVPEKDGVKARRRKRRSLVSTYHYDMRQAVRCGGRAYADVESIYREPIRKWMRANRERIERAFPNAFQRQLPFEPAAE